MVVTLVRDAATAVLEQLTDFGTDNSLSPWNVYLVGKVPPYPVGGTSLDKRNYFPYAVVWSGQRADTSVKRISDDSTTRPFRVVTMFVGLTAFEAAWMEDHVDAALRHQVLTIDGVECSRIHYESGQQIAEDPDNEDVFTGTAVWTFVATMQD